MQLSLKVEFSVSQSAGTKTEFDIILQSITGRQGIEYRYVITLALSLKKK